MATNHITDNVTSCSKKQNVMTDEYFHLFAPLCSFSRPLLVILDRNIDLATPLHHTWTYQALTHDVLVSGQSGY